MTTTKSLAITLVLLLLCSPLLSQTVTINHTVQRYLGNVSQLDRPTYFTIHAAGSDADLLTFHTDFNTYPGRGFWGPFSVAKNETGSVGTYPPLAGGNGVVRGVVRGVQTEHPRNAFVDGINTVAAGAWAADYYMNRVDNNSRPEFFEPMNEPFVHAKDFYSGGWDPSEQARIKLQMAEFFNEIGKKIHATPELANMKVIGYSAAWASLEIDNFNHFNQNQKMFMDVAGANMDAFATHLYDGVNVTGQDNKRSGSNSDAILDLIETYSFTKWGLVKPHAITEYGAIEQGYGDNYSDLASIQSVRSQNHLIFGLLEREDRMAISIPFNTGKATWHITAANNYQPYGAATWKPTNIGQPNPTGWVYTPRIEFYKLWKEVRGKRVEIQTDNPDVQIQAFVDGAKLFVAVNNLDDNTKNVSLNLVSGLSGLQNVRIKTIKIYPNSPYVYSDNTQTTAPSSISLIAGETAILEYTFSNNINFSNAIRSKNYYTSKHLQAITANSAISFNFNNVDIGTGYAKLKMTIGRKHNVSKTPVVTVNGTAVPVPTNIKGYDQANRDDFFGTIDIPVPMNLIQANNTVTFTFPDNGGHLASVILNVEKYDTPVGTSQAPYGGTARAIPGTIEGEHYDTGGEGIAFHDTSAGNSGGNVFRGDEAVDIGNGDGGAVIGWTAAGEWVEYTVNTIAGTYDIEARVSSPHDNKRIVAKLDGVTLGTFTLPNTGAWGTYQTTTLNNIALTGGNGKILRLEFPDGGLNLNWVKFTAVTPANEAFSFTTRPTTLPSQASYDINVTYEAAQSRDLVVEFWSSTGWEAQSVKTVTAGAGTETVTVNLSSAPVASPGYILKGSLRPVGADWTQNIKTDQINNITVTAPANQTPYGGTAWSLPGVVEAENYDNGGQGVAYNDTDAANNGGQYRTDGVDIQTTGDTEGTYNVGWMAASEWLEYTVNVTVAQDYDFFPRVASPVGTGKLKILVDGIDQTGELAVPNTGGYQTYQVMHVRNINLTTGTHIVRIEVVSGDFNLNRWAAWAAQFPSARIAKDPVENPIETLKNSSVINFYPNPLSVENLTIDLGNKALSLIQVYTLQGKKIFEQQTKKNSLIIDRNVFNTSGVYVIKLSNGDHVIRRKLMVH
ncbi:DUF5010 C-terminal domain-containing protein [Fulvivirgaceae bacterium BMA12]|uniref:DUF5010 C-terminal domain-containing protein n=1 Tax=Agaribacillus aureus TaxID=3051825 RepID=A0ABT8LHN2_9BACT|nr:DUF5010 C-terminal domain-containing protein [Fulvivirgaceae bacterium BMA12]